MKITQELLKSKIRYEKDGTIWNIRTGKQTGRTKHNNYYCIDMKSKAGHLRCKVHQAVWILHNGEVPEGYIIDHINGNTYDNRIENLRLATYTQNNVNSKGYNKDGLPKGVRKRGNKFIARIKHNNIEYYLGTYNTVEEAELAYNTKAEEIHGEFAYHLKNVT